MSNPIVIAAVRIAIATPALAGEFYVAQGPKTQKCYIRASKPDGQKMVMIGTTSYATKDEAKAAKQAAGECKKK
jgi:hypothetical protein